MASALAPIESASADTLSRNAADSARAPASTDRLAAIRQAFAQAAFDVGEAYFVTNRYFEPSLNGISVDQVPDVPVSDHPSLRRLVAHATRRTLSPGDAMAGHFAAVLRDQTGCSDERSASGGAAGMWRCGSGYQFRLPTLEGAFGGALEFEAGRRTAGTPIGPFALLTAAFETAQWRPEGVHPMVAESARHAAVGMRLRTRNADNPCHVTALWVLAAVVAEAPDIRLVGNMLWHRGDRSADLGSITRHAARRGCTAAASLAPAPGSASEMLLFWVPETALRIGARAGGDIARALRTVTAGELGSEPLSLAGAWPLEADSIGDGATVRPALTHRACDTLTAVQPQAAMTAVRGVEVHPCLAPGLDALFTEARADGIVLGGWGWRSTNSTIALRQRYCPLPSRSSARYWTVLSLLPSSHCRPPVAPPTRSRHEYGVAVDFTCGSQRAAINSRGSRCYRWLAANAHRSGLYNFYAEPWHWSIDGR